MEKNPNLKYLVAAGLASLVGAGLFYQWVTDDSAKQHEKLKKELVEEGLF